MADTPETSAHTSIKERLYPQFNLESAVKLQVKQQCLQRLVINSGLVTKPLAKFEGNVIQKDQLGILFSLKDYLQFVDYTGRLLQPNKRGQISEKLSPILHRLNLNQKSWLEQATKFKEHYPNKFAKPRTKKLTMTA